MILILMETTMIKNREILSSRNKYLVAIAFILFSVLLSFVYAQDNSQQGADKQQLTTMLKESGFSQENIKFGDSTDFSIDGDNLVLKNGQKINIRSLKEIFPEGTQVTIDDKFRVSIPENSEKVLNSEAIKNIEINPKGKKVVLDNGYSLNKKFTYLGKEGEVAKFELYEVYKTDKYSTTIVNKNGGETSVYTPALKEGESVKVAFVKDPSQLSEEEKKKYDFIFGENGKPIINKPGIVVSTPDGHVYANVDGSVVVLNDETKVTGEAAVKPQGSDKAAVKIAPKESTEQQEVSVQAGKGAGEVQQNYVENGDLELPYGGDKALFSKNGKDVYNTIRSQTIKREEAKALLPKYAEVLPKLGQAGQTYKGTGKIAGIPVYYGSYGTKFTTDVNPAVKPMFEATFQDLEKSKLIQERGGIDYIITDGIAREPSLDTGLPGSGAGEHKFSIAMDVQKIVLKDGTVINSGDMHSGEITPLHNVVEESFNKYMDINGPTVPNGVKALEILDRNGAHNDHWHLSPKGLSALIPGTKYTVDPALYHLELPGGVPTTAQLQDALKQEGITFVPTSGGGYKVRFSPNGDTSVIGTPERPAATRGSNNALAAKANPNSAAGAEMMKLAVNPHTTSGGYQAPSQDSLDKLPSFLKGPNAPSRSPMSEEEGRAIYERMLSKVNKEEWGTYNDETNKGTGIRGAGHCFGSASCASTAAAFLQEAGVPRFTDPRNFPLTDQVEKELFQQGWIFYSTKDFIAPPGAIATGPSRFPNGDISDHAGHIYTIVEDIQGGYDLVADNSGFKREYIYKNNGKIEDSSDSPLFILPPGVYPERR